MTRAPGWAPPRRSGVGAGRPLEHAVVVGASVAGLVAARVLTEYAERVTLVDRDTFADRPEHRRGVPQARHTHVLQPRGLRVLEELLPGFAAGLRDEGAVVLDDLSQMHFCAFGRTFASGPYPRSLTLLATRDLVETHVRSAVLRDPRICLRTQTQVSGLVLEPSSDRVRGVRLGTPTGTETVPTDLVVDASGRGSRVDRWLVAAGRGPSRVVEQQIGVRYATQLVRLPEDRLPQRLVVVGPRPGRPRGFYLPRYQGGLRMVTVMGYGADSPGPSRTDLLTWTRELAPPEVAAAVLDAEQVGPVAGYRFDASRRRLLGAAHALPGGLVVLGDALCTFNPIYGQGMTVACCQAVELGRALSIGTGHLTRRFQTAADRVADQAWEVSVPADRGILSLPQPPRERIEQRFLGRLLDRARDDPTAAVAVLDVLTMNRSKRSLMRPGPVYRAVSSSRARVPR